MSKWWKIFPWKSGKGSVSPTLPCENQHWCTNTIREAPPTLESDHFWYFTAFVIPEKCQCEIHLPRPHASRGWEEPLSSFHLKMDVVCLQPVSIPRSWTQTAFHLLVMLLFAYACPLPLFILYKRYFPFLKAGTSVNSDLPFPASPQWEFLHSELPSTLPETDYFVPQKQTISFPRRCSLETGIGYIQNTAETD